MESIEPMTIVYFFWTLYLTVFYWYYESMKNKAAAEKKEANRQLRKLNKFLKHKTPVANNLRILHDGTEYVVKDTRYNFYLLQGEFEIRPN